MDIYHIWAELKDGIEDHQFADDLGRYMAHLRDRGLIERWRLARKKLGLAPDWASEFHIMVETTDLTQLDAAFKTLTASGDPVEDLQKKVYNAFAKASYGLYRDWPD